MQDLHHLPIELGIFSLQVILHPMGVQVLRREQLGDGACATWRALGCPAATACART